MPQAGSPCRRGGASARRAIQRPTQYRHSSRKQKPTPKLLRRAWRSALRRALEGRKWQEATKKVMHGDYEHLDHTADVQFHAWGVDFEKALEAFGCCLFDYVTEIVSINETEEGARTHEIEGADMKKFIFNFLDELLYAVCLYSIGDDIACRTVSVKLHSRDPREATVRTTSKKVCDLENFLLGGNAVKAIACCPTMQIHEKADRPCRLRT